jgi:hypothetical protein
MTPGTAPQVAGFGGDVKPTLLAFHGSGSNATIHTVQLARLMRVIKGHFEVESMEGVYTKIPVASLLHASSPYTPLGKLTMLTKPSQRHFLLNRARVSSPSSKAAVLSNAGCDPPSPSPT